MAGRLAKLSTAEIWKIEVKWIMSKNVHVYDIFIPVILGLLYHRGVDFACYTLRAFQNFRNEEPQLSNKLRVPTPLLLLIADVWGLVGIRFVKTI